MGDLLLLLIIFIPGALMAFAKMLDDDDYKAGRQKKQYGSYKGQRYTKEGQHQQGVITFIFVVAILFAIIMAIIGG